MAKSIDNRLQRLEAHAEQRRAASAQPSVEEWFRAAQSDDLSYAGWMKAHGYSEKMIATILARRAQAEETLRLFDDSLEGGGYAHRDRTPVTATGRDEQTTGGWPGYCVSNGAR